MSTRRRQLILFLLSPSLVFAHGTEIGGLYLGTFAAVIAAVICSVVLPSRPRRRFLPLAALGPAAIATFFAVAAYQNVVNDTLGQSVWVWAVFSAVLQLFVVGVVYYEFCRPKSSDQGQKNPKEP